MPQKLTDSEIKIGSLVRHTNGTIPELCGAEGYVVGISGYVVTVKLTKEPEENPYNYTVGELKTLHLPNLTDISQKLDTVAHPAHYGGDTTYEAIKVIEAWGLGFRLGNTVKYISRAGKKHTGKRLEDLKKARWYLDRDINAIEAESSTS